MDQEAEPLPSSTQYEQTVVPDFQDPRAVRAFLGRVFGYEGSSNEPEEKKNIQTTTDDGMITFI